jgi:hypothetical protein
MWLLGFAYAMVFYWTSVAYMDVGKGREQERKLTPLRLRNSLKNMKETRPGRRRLVNIARNID